MTQQAHYTLGLTTQGPTYPPSEVMNGQGRFIVIGRINRPAPGGGVRAGWSRALVAADSPVPVFGEQLPYRIVRELPPVLSAEDEALVLHTLPLPLPCNNYPMVFAPERCPQAGTLRLLQPGGPGALAPGRLGRRGGLGLQHRLPVASHERLTPERRSEKRPVLLLTLAPVTETPGWAGGPWECRSSCSSGAISWRSPRR